VNPKDPLTQDNFLLFVMKHYDNPSCKDMEEFMEDLERVKYIKRLLNKFEKKDSLKERLILNHIIILNNVFGAEACARILFFRLEPEYHSCLKSFLKYLQILPIKIPDLDLNQIPTDHRIDSILKTIH
jgi:hypothetical protein